MKRAFFLLLVLILVVTMPACSSMSKQEPSNPSESESNKQALNDFYNKLAESKELLDTLADDIYDNWYAAEHNNAFGGDANAAILAAEQENAEKLNQIKTLDTEIVDLYKEVKDSLPYSLYRIMTVYTDYYETVVNVKPSVTYELLSYSYDREEAEKELASLLRDLSYEI